jgi:hypothetical protein
MRNEEELLVQDVMGIFTGAKLVVLADQFHDDHESGDELTWLQGELGNEIEDCQSEQREQDRLLLRQSILWRDWTQYGKFADIDEEKLREEWDRYRGREGYDMPRVVRKSITTASLKRRLLAICGPENKFRHLVGLDWAFVTGDHDYTGRLDLDQQIAFLELSLGQIAKGIKYDSQGREIEEGCVWDVLFLGSKIDKLIYERELRELIISEAEEVN